MKFQVEQKKLRFETFITKRVPKLIKTDPKRLKQILFNIIGNAIKFTFSGSITVSVDCRDEYLITEVQDTGIGIKNEEINQLFKFFGKVEHSKKINKGGMGFGLSISKMILQQMNGEISVKSEF